MNMINTKTGGTPAFLKEKLTEVDKTVARRAWARYLAVVGKSAAEGAKLKPNLRALLPILKELDSRWESVEPEQMVTTHTLIHRINAHINTFKTQTADVATLIEALKAEVEPSVDPEQTVNKSPTESEGSNQDEGEVEKTPWEQKPETSEFENCVMNDMAEQFKKDREQVQQLGFQQPEQIQKPTVPIKIEPEEEQKGPERQIGQKFV